MAMILDNRVTDPGLDIPFEKPGIEYVPDQPEPVKHRDSPMNVRVKTTRFGTLEVEQDLIIYFADGIIGFEQCQRYIVVRHDENSSFRWLQSLDNPSVAFPIVEPSEFRPDYAPTISDLDAKYLELEPMTPNLLFAIVTVPPSNPRSMTANLLGPLVINAITRRGKQVIVQDDCYNTRHEIMEELERTNALAITPGSSPPRPTPISKMHGANPQKLKTKVS